MRTKYSIAACLFALSFFTSCNDSFLQRDPKDKYSDVFLEDSSRGREVRDGY